MMTTGKMILMLRDLQREHETIARSDCLGRYDKEHLESAQAIVNEMLEDLMASKWRLRREISE